MKKLYFSVSVFLLSFLMGIPLHAGTGSQKNWFTRTYSKTPKHAKQAALGIPLLALGIILNSSYGSRPSEISDKIRGLKHQLGRGNNKTLKKQIRMLRLNYGGHVALKVLAYIASLLGGALTMASVFEWWGSRTRRETQSGQDPSIFLILPEGGLPPDSSQGSSDAASATRGGQVARRQGRGGSPHFPGTGKALGRG